MARRERLAKGLARERSHYLGTVQGALAGAEAARVVLQGVVRRMERG